MFTYFAKNISFITLLTTYLYQNTPNAASIFLNKNMIRNTLYYYEFNFFYFRIYKIIEKITLKNIWIYIF